jgi:hypothetical protein
LSEFPAAGLSSIADAAASPYSFAVQTENSLCVITLKMNETIRQSIFMLFKSDKNILPDSRNNRKTEEFF